MNINTSNNKTQKFKHSGALGDLIYSLPVVKHFGGGEFYLHLNQMAWIGQHYYGSLPDPFHKDRMTLQDYNYMQSFMQAQSYITQFDTLTPDREITHNLDKFRPLFVGHPTNYIDLYAQVFGIVECLSDQPWLTAPDPKPISGRPIVINRTERWIPPTPNPQWGQWRAQGWADQAVFVGLRHEYQKFQADTGWTSLPWVETPTMLDLANVIAGASMFIGNQSSALALAIGLGVADIRCEARTDMPLERNECYFPRMTNVVYF